MRLRVRTCVAVGLTLSVLVAGCGESSAPAPAAETPTPAAAARAPVESAQPAAAPAGGPDDSITTARANVEAGTAIYKQFCIACHQADGTGMDGMLTGNLVGRRIGSRGPMPNSST